MLTNQFDFGEDGVWLQKSQAASACGKSVYEFGKDIEGKLKSRKVQNHLEYFLPFKKMIKEARQNFQDIQDEQNVNSIIGDLTGSSDKEIDYTANSTDLVQARLQNLQIRTKVLQEKLTELRNDTWNSWNAEFFEIFSESFARYKNNLISLHLDEKQLELLQTSLENALKSLKDKLQGMYQRYMNENEGDIEQL